MHINDDYRYYALRYQQERQASLTAEDRRVAAIHGALADLYRQKLQLFEPPPAASQPPTLMQRAFELAREGQIKTVSKIAKALKAEGYHRADLHLAAPTLNKQLKALIKGSAEQSTP